MKKLTIKKARSLGRDLGLDHDGFADMDSDPCRLTAAQHGRHVAEGLLQVKDSFLAEDVRGLKPRQKAAFVAGFASGIAKTYRDDPRYRRCSKHR